MNRLAPPKDRRGFDVAIICALDFEAHAIEYIFDNFWNEQPDDRQYGKLPEDENTYRTGVISNHNVVLTYMPGMGKSFAASATSSVRLSFPNIRLALVVGICGGVPSPFSNGTNKKIFLGDIVISDEIVVYDYGKMLPTGFSQKKPETVPVSNREVRTFLHKLKGPRGYNRLIERSHHHLAGLQKERPEEYFHPPRRFDRLFESSYHHKHRRASNCKSCKEKSYCETAHEATCEVLKCSSKRLVARSRSTTEGIDVHFGRMASADTVMKSSIIRDRIAEEANVIAFEMESAEVHDNLPCIVVKGVCDYADSHKDKIWQKCSAGGAAACVKALLEQWASVNQVNYGYDQQENQSTMPPEQPRSTKPIINTAVAPSPQDFQNEELFKVFDKIKPSFKATIKSLREQKKSLPRDVDLKLTLKTQLKLCSAIIAKLQSIQDITNRLPTSLKAESGKPSAMDKLKDCVQDLRSLVQNLESSIFKPKKYSVLENPLPSTGSLDSQKFHHFRVVQKAAHSLYAAFETACNAHSVHDVYLSLQPHLNGDLTRVRFNIAFQNPQASGRMAWINVESTMKSVESFIPTNPPHVVETPLRKRRRERESQSAEYRQKRVHFQTSIQPIQFQPSHIPEGPAGNIPSLHLQRNFCVVLERFFREPLAECTGCLGLLGNSEICKHLAYINTEVGHQAPSLSLSEFLASSKADSTGEIGLYEQIRLARYLATAVLYYHATPWLRQAWRGDSVRFFGDHSSLYQQRPVLSYMTTSIRASNNSSKSQSEPETAESYDFIRNPVLFGLGIMLLEIAFEAPLRTLQQTVDLEKGGIPGFADYFTAQRLVDLAGRTTTKDFRDIIKKCLYCDFGHDNDFKSPALQEAFYWGVITELESLEKLFQKLQIDD
ncbi:hypothetical protein N7520_005845 [Penicillium odoratum]|uniref:uncharacterized protein n=1 Tax=Penicillium odoratum TaxID=1167516 RepID=UPI002548E721|nr:uncharacterized protein N7520_005845 [Penicillium odoratum]KAJ5758689.1 hypothetical protein N7520_005845 [Penicillium odoratum]